MVNTEQELAEDPQSLITVNDLLLTRNPDEDNQSNHYCRINDISEGKIVVAWPTSGGVRLMVHTDQILDFSFVRDGIAYSFSGLVDETVLEPLPQVTLIQCSAIMRVQRRENFRIKCLVPVEIGGTVKERTQNDNVSVLGFKTTTYDISASGISIRYYRSLPEGALLDIKLSLPDNKPVIKVPCRVVYSEKLIEKTMQYRTGMHYLVISESERARIVRYVYRTQLKGLR
jgi:c-di-GMP-binding flagellar brake protein YcgR